MSMQRLRTDFHFAVITLFSVIAMLGIAPFAVYRLFNGQDLAAGIDAGIVLCIVGGCVHTWRGGDLRNTAMVVVCVLTVGCLAAVRVIGLVGLLWMYPLLAGNFLMVSRTRALGIALAAIAALVLLERGVFSDHLQAFVFVVTALVTSLFAYIFAQRTEIQRAQLEVLAAHDALTGAGNRRTMSRDLGDVVEAAAHSGAPAGLALLDLDHFKRVNDARGHEHGDSVLVAFAELIRANMRGSDHFFRSGGEEFVVLAPHTDLAGLRILAEHLRARVAEQLRSDGEPVTVSIGIAALRQGESPAQWMGRADAAMYRAKHLGRNRVVADTDPDLVA